MSFTFKKIQSTQIPIEQIFDLYENVGWSNYLKNKETLLKGLEASLLVVAAFDGLELIGLIRVVGDGFTIIYIQDILVKTTHQRQGIGKQLINLVLEKYQSVRQKILLTDNQAHLKAFYNKNGFKATEDLGLVCFVKV